MAKKKLDEALVQGRMQSKPLTNKHIGSVSQVTRIEEDLPGHLHELYRYAIELRGSKASFGELAEVMNVKSLTKNVYIKLSSYQLYRWFKSNGGKEISPVEKPKDTPKLILKRLMWIQKWEK